MQLPRGLSHVARWLKAHVFAPVTKTFTAFGQDDGYLLAAGVAYYVGLSLFPMLWVLMEALGLFLRFTHLGQNAKDEILDAISINASPETAKQVGDVLVQLQQGGAPGGLIGVAIVLFTAGTIFAQFERAFDRIWRYTAPEDLGWVATIRSVLFERLTAFVLLIGVGALVVLTLIASSILEGVKRFADHYLPLPPNWWDAVQAATAIVINTAAFGMLYHTLPRARVRWKEAFRGGLIVAIVWEVGRRVLTAYLIGGRYTAYGVVGALIAVQLWAYYAVTVILLGAEYVRVTCKYCTGEAAAEATRRRFWQLMTKMYAKRVGAPVTPPVAPPAEPQPVSPTPANKP
jgi:membrane protein